MDKGIKCVVLACFLAFFMATAGCFGGGNGDDDDDDGKKENKELTPEEMDYKGYTEARDAGIKTTIKYIITDEIIEINTTMSENFVYIKFRSTGDDEWAFFAPPFGFIVGDSITWEYYWNSDNYSWVGMLMGGDSSGAWDTAKVSKV